MSFLTILNHADEGDDDQEVDIFHHFHIHGVCVRVEAECLSVRRCVCATAKHWLQTWAISHFLLWKCGCGLIQMGVNKKAWYFLFMSLCKANYVAQTFPYSLKFTFLIDGLHSPLKVQMFLQRPLRDSTDALGMSYCALPIYYLIHNFVNDSWFYFILHYNAQ